MASFNLSVTIDSCESKKLSFKMSSADWCFVTGTARIFYSCRKLGVIRFSSSDAEFSEIAESNRVGDALEEASKGHFCRDIWRNGNRLRAIKKVTRGPAELNLSSQGLSVTSDKEFDASLPYCTAHDLGLEECNGILKQLEKSSEGKALSFFEWMRSNGKLKQNRTAYNLVLRVLGRRGDWDAADVMVKQICGDSGCELNFQVFNTVIYACSKQGHVGLGAKWFRMMLEYNVQPTVATFGMLMKLYQKGWNLKEAEFAFSHMRNLKLRCELAYSAMITLYTRMRLYDKAEEIIGFLREDGVTLNRENWIVLLNAYSQQGKLENAELILASMHEAGFPPDIIAYNALITGYGKVANMDAAHRLFCNLAKAGLEPDETTYRSMVEGWGRANNYGKAKWFYEKLKRSGFKPNSSNLFTMLNLEARNEDKEGALRTVDDMVMMGCQYSTILSSLLQAYERAGRVEEVPRILTSCFYDHVAVNQHSCSILVTAYLRHGIVDDAIQILRDKQWNDLYFEHNLYHLLICSCKDLGRLEDAVKLYSHMPKSRKPNLHIMCTMIDIYRRMNLFTEAGNIYLELKSSGIALDMISFSVVVRMYAKAGLPEEAYSVLETMEKDKSIVPDIHLFRDMLRIYKKCGKLEKLVNLYYKILKSEIAWDRETYMCVINCCAQALPVDELSRIFNEMLQLGFLPNTTTFNVMLHAYGKGRLLKKAEKVFLMAKKKGLVDVISYNTLVAAYGQRKDFHGMSSTVQNMQFNGFSVSLEAYNCMLDAYGKHGQVEKFRNVLQRMKDAGCASSHYTYNIMINIYGKQGWIAEVAEVLRELKGTGLRPDLCSYNTLIKAYGIAGLVEDAVAVVGEMRQNGIVPDKVTYVTLVSALRRNDMFLEAVKWSLWMKQIGLESC